MQLGSALFRSRRYTTSVCPLADAIISGVSGIYIIEDDNVIQNFKEYIQYHSSISILIKYKLFLIDDITKKSVKL